MGTVRGRSTHYLPTRETNFRRARKTVLGFIRNNARWTVAVICKVLFNEDGTEKDLKEIWRSNPIKRP
jgi:hypothetical protein